MEGICINTILYTITWLQNNAGSRPTSRGSSTLDNNAPTYSHPLTISAWIHPSVSLPQSREMETIHCWKLSARSLLLNGPNHPGRVTHWHPPSGQDRVHTCPFQAATACVKNTDRLYRVYVRLFHSEHKECLFLKHLQVFSVLVDVQCSGGEHSPLVGWINAMFDPWRFI